MNILNLILAMIRSLDYHDSSELNFSKDDIDYFINKDNLLDKLDCDDKGIIILWQNNYIDNNIFSKEMGTYYEDGIFYLVYNNFEELLVNNETEAKIMDDDIYLFENEYTYENIIIDYWYMFNIDTLNHIINFCVENKLKIKEEFITHQNTKIINNDIYFKDKPLKKYLNKLSKLENLLLMIINDSISIAYYDAAYKKIKNMIEDNIGTFKWKRIYNNKDESLLVNVNITWYEVLKYLDEYSDDFDFESSNYGSLTHILKDMNYFDIGNVNYDNLYINLDKVELNNNIINNL